MKKLFILLIFCLIYNYLALGQTTITGVVTSAEDKSPIPGASVFVKGSAVSGTATNNEGKFTLQVSNSAKTLIFSFVGMKTTEIDIKGNVVNAVLESEDVNVEDVVVTGQNVPKKVDKSIYKIDLIGIKQLESRGVNNLAEALSNETNIRLSVDPALGTKMELQGLSGENVKILIDGVPIIGRLDGNVDLSQINMDNVDHIEIVQGPMSVVYGTNALAGVVNIITKENIRNSQTLKLSSYTGTEGSYNLNATAGIVKGKNSFTLAGSRNMFQGIDLDKSNRYLEFKPKLQYNGNFDYVYTNSKFKTRFKSAYFDEEIRHYGNIQGVSASDQYFFTNRFVNSLQVNNKVGEGFFYEFLGAYSYYDRTTKNFRKDLTTFDQVQIGSSVASTFTNGMLRGNFSIAKPDAKINYQFGFDLNLDDAKGDRISTNKPQMGDYAAYLSTQIQASRNISIQPGLRFIYNTKYGAPLVPSINIQYTLKDNINFRASYARGFRSPTLKELYLNMVDANHDLHGNPNLKAETNNSYNTSFTYTLQNSKFKLKFEPSVFYNDGKNIIDLIGVNEATNTYQNTNIGQRKTLGGQMNISFLLFPDLTINCGYSKTGVKYSAEISSTGSATDFTFYSNYTFSGNYVFRKQKVDLALNTKYYGATPMLMNKDADNNPATPSVPVTVNKKAYPDMEFTATKRIWNNRLSIIAGGKNLFNVKFVGYDDGTLATSPTAFGRYFFLKLNLNISSIN